jgi:hypothetical protein
MGKSYTLNADGEIENEEPGMGKQQWWIRIAGRATHSLAECDVFVCMSR